VNRSNMALYNSLMTANRTLPWLQDTLQDAVWNSWQVSYRDVRILDAQGRLYGVFNLTEHDLSSEGNQATLQELLLGAARAIDSDKDSLPDDWEILHFGNLSARPEQDPDGDGYDNFTEFAFGSDPTDPQSHPRISAKLLKGQQNMFTVEFHRPAGGILKYPMETSADLAHWIDGTGQIFSKPTLNLYDGTGTAGVSFTVPNNDQRQIFLRVLASPGR